MRNPKILLAEPGVQGMTKPEIDSFLGSGKMILRLGTVDSGGDPVIHPVWYFYENGRIYIFTSKNRKLENITRRGRVYFSVDIDVMPNKGVKGKGDARVVGEDRRVSMGEKIVKKYMGDSPETEYGKSLLRFARGPRSVVVEIAPKFYTVWDYAKLM